MHNESKNDCIQHFNNNYFISEHKGSSFFLLSLAHSGHTENIQINSTAVKYYTTRDDDVRDNGAPAQGLKKDGTDYNKEDDINNSYSSR